MKRITSIIVIMILCLSLLSMNVFAAGATVSVTGPQSAEAGEAVQVKLNLTATNIYAMSGTISYNASQLRLENAAAGYGGLSVAVNTANNKFTVYHNGGEYLENGTIVVLNFTVLEDTAGATVSVGFGGLEVTDAVNDQAVSAATHSFNIVVPETTEPETTEPESTEPESTEPESTEPTTEATEPEATEPSVEATEPSGEPTEPVVEPTEPGANDGDGEKKCCWWCWILILILIACGIWILIVVLRKKKRKEQEKQ